MEKPRDCKLLYAECCKLLYAECLANDGELAAAMQQVNDIRERAAKEANIIYLDDGTPAANYLVNPYPSSHAAFTDKATCIKAIRMERKLELAMEGQRFFDAPRAASLRRIRTAIPDQVLWRFSAFGRQDHVPDPRDRDTNKG